MDNNPNQRDYTKGILRFDSEALSRWYNNPDEASLYSLHEASRTIPREQWKERFAIIKQAYSIMTPRILEAAQHGRTVNPYFLEWLWSPIEFNAWCEIRRLPVPFYPEYPACGYFLDFADPIKKIGIELDGKDFHDAARDAVRDQRLAANGWEIFRLSGAQCNRYMADELPKHLRYVDEEGGDQEEMDERRSWDDNLRLTTIDGFFEWLDFNYYHPTHYYGRYQ